MGIREGIVNGWGSAEVYDTCKALYGVCLGMRLFKWPIRDHGH